MDGDLGQYDVIEPRLLAADTIIVLDVSPWKCTWRAVRRSRERADFWRWTWRWRRLSRPLLLEAVAANASGAEFQVLRNTRAVEEFLARFVGAP
jgi:predicted exporter